MRAKLIRLLGGYAEPLDALDAIKEGDAQLCAAYIEYLGGFPTWEAALEHVRAAPIAARHSWLTAAVKRLFNTIGDNDVLRQHESGHWLWQGRPLSEGQFKMLQAEAKAFHESFLWKTLSTELIYQANKATYTQAEDIPDIVAGKMLLYYVDIVKTRLGKIVTPDRPHHTA